MKGTNISFTARVAFVTKRDDSNKELSGPHQINVRAEVRNDLITVTRFISTPRKLDPALFVKQSEQHLRKEIDRITKDRLEKRANRTQSTEKSAKMQEKT